MKKILLILLIIPFFIFATDKQNLSDQEIKEKIIGKWNMYEFFDQANIITFHDNGTVSFKVYICDNNAKKALYNGEYIHQYKIENGAIYVGQLSIKDGFVQKLKVKSIDSSALRLIYDMPGYPSDKEEVNYLNTTNKDTLPFCKYNKENPFRIKVDNQKLQADLNLVQDKIIESFKKMIPKDLDEYTVLQDVYKNNNELFFKLSLKKVSKDGFNNEILRAFLKVSAVNKYCNMDSTLKILQQLKMIFPDGASYIYSVEDEKPFVVHVDDSSCQK
ncbi:hypothetical protein [Gilliamella sp. wkB112]|uniref:hypothetical protein n=1 Tax=Gilliamella sp. wkB112 TaxID=3120257 RepID=UPI00080DCA11|nr:hypothetical protein [Gilliamella apicola]OCG03023.1 hypothetical protein A9G12_08875 [Gilliamella apicola]